MRQCIFEDTEGREHLYERSIQQVFERAVNKAGIRKYVCDHSLRQAFTTNFIENGVDRRFIQEFPEHSSAKTTAIITHVEKKSLSKIGSPLPQRCSVVTRNVRTRKEKKS